jgi:acyl-CoA synthetase (AMP-forming)/AMP-acid ligase II
MNQPWLAAYPAGVPAQIDPDRYPSVAALFAESCSRFRDRPAVTSMGVTLAYRDLQRLVGHFAAWLQADGIGKGDRVAIMLPNVLQYAVVLFGVLRAGAAVVNINPLYTASELTQQLADSGARAIVVLEHFAGTLKRALQQAGGWLFTGDMGRMDERGYVTFVERKKEVIVVSGFKAYPAEIEVVARLHPGVDDVAAVGVPDAHSGEAVATRPGGQAGALFSCAGPERRPVRRRMRGGGRSGRGTRVPARAPRDGRTAYPASR